MQVEGRIPRVRSDFVRITDIREITCPLGFRHFKNFGLYSTELILLINMPNSNH